MLDSKIYMAFEIYQNNPTDKSIENKRLISNFILQIFPLISGIENNAFWFCSLSLWDKYSVRKYEIKQKLGERDVGNIKEGEEKVEKV